ncbi:MAG: biopolymer transporter ExbD [Pseudomonadota bacterium]
MRRQTLYEDAKVDLTPMLDIVFILLIFFIVTSTFIQEDAIGMEPPPPACPGCDTSETRAIVVYIDAKNVLRVGKSLTDISAVRSEIERRRAESPNAAVIIQADGQAHTGTVIKVRDIVYDANVERVNIVRSST